MCLRFLPGSTRNSGTTAIMRERTWSRHRRARRGARVMEPSVRRLGEGAPHAGRADGRRADDDDHCRQPKGPFIHHSDQGTQHTSLGFGQRCREAGVVKSIGSVGDVYDNAICESSFAPLECELLDRRQFPTVADARRGVFSFIEDSYNTRWLHSALGYESPSNFEKLNHAALSEPAAPGRRIACWTSPARPLLPSRSLSLSSVGGGREEATSETPSTPNNDRP